MKIRKVVTGLLLAGGVCSAAVTVGANFGMMEEVEAATTKTATKTTKETKTPVKKGWVSENGKYKYYGKDGKAYTGWHYMGKAEGEKTAHWSYFGKDGFIYTGWHKMGKAEGEKTEHWSYFGPNGWLRIGWQQMGKGTSNPDGNSKAHWSYFGGNGWLQTGWKHFNKTKKEAAHDSYFGSNGWLVTSATMKVDGTNYKFDGKGWASKAEITSTSDVDTSGWKSGVASAYGGKTDPGCGSTTATGAKVTESSMGVAIPMAWGRRDLLGHKVMIAYGNKVVTATINDVGGMGGGSRALDLQPGVFRAFGFNSCNSWGVRTVKYKIL